MLKQGEKVLTSKGKTGIIVEDQKYLGIVDGTKTFSIPKVKLGTREFDINYEKLTPFSKLSTLKITFSTNEEEYLEEFFYVPKGYNLISDPERPFSKLFKLLNTRIDSDFINIHKVFIY